jgi:hypothetical protein
MSNAAFDRFEQRLDEAVASVNKTKTTTVVLYVLLAAIIGGYLTWAGIMVREMVNPANLSPIITTKINDSIPQARREIASRIKKEAPLLVDQATARLLEQLPEGRKAIRETVEKLAEEQIHKIERDLDALVSDALQRHGDELNAVAKDLQTDEGREAFENSLYAALTEPLNDPTINPNIKGYGLLLQQLADRLERLATATDLTEQERTERDFLIAIREVSQRTPKYRPELERSDAVLLGK